MAKNWQPNIMSVVQQFTQYFIEGFGDTYDIFYYGDAMCKRGKYCITCRQKASIQEAQAAGRDLPKGETAMTDDILCFFL